MKLAGILTLLATVAIATPAHLSEFKREPQPHPMPDLVERKPCYHSSDCSWFYGT